MLDRRQFLGRSGAAVGAVALGGCAGAAPWERAAYRKRGYSRVAVLRASSYDGPLPEIVRRGLELFRLSVVGKTVVLKPNLVEYDPGGVVNTHPAVIAAAVDAFRRLGARSVIVAEGPGHRRDTEHLLTASGLHAVLRELGAPYVDLNHDDARSVPLRSWFTDLGRLYFPETVLKADLLVSMPKLKTHHWAGVTLALKNLFGVLPGHIYGWPKNVLHWAGIHQSILDINSTLPIPQFAIVDGIVGMEGNGPIHGDRKDCGLLVFGDDLVAVDATASRLMQIEPARVEHLAQASRFLGNSAEDAIIQIGEHLRGLAQDFRVVGALLALKSVRGSAPAASRG